MAMGSTQPLTEMCTRSISWRSVRKADNLPPSCAVVTKSGNLNFLEHSGPVQACNGTALYFLFVLFSSLKLKWLKVLKDASFSITQKLARFRELCSVRLRTEHVCMQNTAVFFVKAEENSSVSDCVRILTFHRHSRLLPNDYYIWLNQLSNTTNLWWIDVYYLVINYMFRRLWPSSG